MFHVTLQDKDRKIVLSKYFDSHSEAQRACVDYVKGRYLHYGYITNMSISGYNIEMYSMFKGELLITKH